MKNVRFFCIILSFAMLLSLFSCGEENVKPAEKQDGETTSAETEALGLLEALDRIFGEDETVEETEEAEEEKEPEKSKVTPLLYKVTDEDGDYIWLFGSIHVGRDDYYPLPDYVMDAYKSADSLAVEFDIIAYEKDMSAVMEDMMLMLYMDGTTIEDHVSEEVYTEAVAILKENDYYNELMDMYCASFWGDMISSFIYTEMGVDMENGIDKYLLNKAKKDEKEIIEVESASFQFGMMADFSDELQEILLEDSISSYYEDREVLWDELNVLTDAWALGNEENLVSMLCEDMEAYKFESKEEEELYLEYNNAMIVERNLYMADFAEEALKNGEEMFICVGTAHVVGEGAMVDLLEERGYTVEKFGGTE